MVYDYAWPFVILVVIIIIFGVAYANAAPLTVKKEIQHVKTQDDMIKSFKVALTLKNRKNKTLENMRVVDRISSLAQFVKGEHNAPAKITQSAKEGTIVEYHFNLEPKEERVIIYDVRAKFDIIGGLKIKPAVVKYKYNGKERKATSNAFEIRV